MRIERFFAVKELIIHMNVSYENMLYLKFGYYILILVFFLHVNACFWFILINQSQVWIPPLDFIEAGYERKHRFYYEYSVFHQYIVCFYYSFVAILYNEMGPREISEILVLAF